VSLLGRKDRAIVNGKVRQSEEVVVVSLSSINEEWLSKRCVRSMEQFLLLVRGLSENPSPDMDPSSLYGLRVFLCFVLLFY